MATQGGATKPAQTQISFRAKLAKRKLLESFAIEDGHVTESGTAELSPLMREVIEFYIKQRSQGGRDAVRVA